VNLETFFEKFDQFADAPNTVEKLRELVLEFAVRGKLVPQEPNVEPASDLIKKIRIEKARRLSRVEFRGDKLTGENSEIPFAIPDSWEWVGATFPALMVSDRGKKVQTKDVADKGLYPVVDQGKVFIRGYCSDHEKVIHVVKPIILFGDHTRETKFIDFDFIVGADGVKLLQPLCVNPLFFYLALRWLPLDSRGYGRHFKLLRAAVIPLPPLAEQKRIMAKVDELMALCDRLEAQLQEHDTQQAALARAALARFAEAPTLANLNFLFHDSYAIEPADLRKTILSLAVRGELVPQDPNDEPSENTLARLQLQSTAALKNDAVAEEKSMPSSWTRVRFEDIAVVAGGVTLGRKLVNRRTITLPYLRVANVKRGKLDLNVIKEVTIAEDEVERYRLRKDDLLMTEGGDWDKVGRAAIWHDEIPVCLHQNHVFRARMRSDEVSPIWFELYFNSPYGRSYFESASKQTTNLASINMRQVKSCPVPFPPLPEQRRIVAKVDQLMTLVDQLEAQLAASRKTATSLMNAVVGELTDGA
jgi:type I restriction enzyme S subunit